jgi:hypothetical protein
LVLGFAEYDEATLQDGIRRLGAAMEAARQ